MYLSNLSTNRLKIRALEERDADAWADFFRNNEDGLKFFTFDLSKPALQLSKEWIGKQLLRYQENRFGLLALADKKTDNLIGQCGLLLQEVEGKPEIEIGYHILPQFQGNGYATEAAKAFRNFAWEKTATSTLVSIINVANTRSQRVAEKNEMVRTKLIDYFGEPVYIYRINKPI